MTPLEVLESRKIAYRVSGNDLLIHCLNPEHKDTNPSMRVDRSSGIFHCFSCGHKGNLLERFNVYRSKTQVLRERLKAKVEAQKLENVGMQMPESAELWDTDYRGISADTFIKFKAFTHSEFPNRIVFPITDITGKISLFQARSLDDSKPKYIFYPRHVSPPLFPLPVQPLFGSIILVEGIFDMLNLYDKGIKNVVCGFGTKSVNEEKLSLLRMLGTTTLIIFLDGDEPGQKAAAEIKTVADSMGFETRNIYRTNKDPGELTQQEVESVKQKLWPEYY